MLASIGVSILGEIAKPILVKFFGRGRKKSVKPRPKLRPRPRARTKR